MNPWQAPMRAPFRCSLWLVLLACLLQAFPPPRERVAFEAATWVVVVDVMGKTSLSRAFPSPSPIPEQTPVEVRLPDGSTLTPLPGAQRLQEDGALFDARVREVLKGPKGSPGLHHLSIYDNGFFSSATEHAEQDRRMILFLVPARPAHDIQARYPRLLESPRWEVLRAFAIDGPEPEGRDTEEGLRTLVRMKRTANAAQRLAVAEEALWHTRSVHASRLAQAELEALLLDGYQELPSDPEAHFRTDSARKRRVATKALEAALRWEQDRRSSPNRHPGLVLQLLSFAQALGVPPPPAVVLRHLGQDGAPVTSEALHLLDKASLEKGLPQVRACIHGRDDDLARAAMESLATHRPELLEEELQATDLPPLRNVEGQDMLTWRKHTFRLPRRHQAFRAIDPLLRTAVAKALAGEFFLLRCDLTTGIGRFQVPSEPWRQALRLLEPLLNDPAPDRAAVVVAAFRTHHIPLRLVEGKYVPDYSGRALPPVELRLHPPEATLTLKAPRWVEAEMRSRPEGMRVEASGSWHAWVYRPRDNFSTWMAISPAEAVSAGANRWRLDLGRLLREPGTYEVTLGRQFDQDDRQGGGAWTGVVWADKVQVRVE